MKRIFAILAVLVATLAACRKEAVKKEAVDEAQKAVYGSISGNISPAGAAESVIWVNDADPALFSTLQPDARTGTFLVSQLKPGIYHIYVVPKSGYTLTQTEATVWVTAGEIMHAGVFKAVSPTNPVSPADPVPAKVYSLSYKLNGDVEGFGSLATYTGTDLTITGFRSEGTYGKLNYASFKTAISIAGVTGPGDYPATITYVSTKGTIGFKTWGSAPAGGSAKVSITAIDPVSKKISGSITGTLQPISGTSGVLSLTEGKFNITYR